MVEQKSEHRQQPAVTANDDAANPKPETIGEFLKFLRGGRTLRRVEIDTGISNSYLSNLEMGHKKPGLKSLCTLAAYYDVPLAGLLEQAGIDYDDHQVQRWHNVLTRPWAIRNEIQRSYQFVLNDPQLALYQKPVDEPTVETQKFVVQMYEHYTGKKLI